MRVNHKKFLAADATCTFHYDFALAAAPIGICINLCRLVGSGNKYSLAINNIANNVIRLLQMT